MDRTHAYVALAAVVLTLAISLVVYYTALRCSAATATPAPPASTPAPAAKSPLIYYARLVDSDDVTNTVSGSSVTLQNNDMLKSDVPGENGATALRSFSDGSLSFTGVAGVAITDEFTISAWVRPDAAALADAAAPEDNKVIFAVNRPAASFSDNVLNVETDQIVCNSADGIAYVTSGFNHTFVAGQWTYVLLRVQRMSGTQSRVELAMDGVVVHAFAAPSVELEAGDYINVFGDYDQVDGEENALPVPNGNFFTGHVKDLRLYNAFVENLTVPERSSVV